MKEALRSLGMGAGAAAVAIVLVGIGLALAGYPAAHVLADWLTSAIGTPGNIAVGLKNACPLILTGLAVGVAFRCGVLNIGAEGQALMGALAATALATRLVPSGPGWVVIPLALAAGATGGAVWAGIAAVLERLRRVPVVLSTILLNFIALSVLGLVLEGPLHARGTTAFSSDPLPRAYWLPRISAFDPAAVLPAWARDSGAVRAVTQLLHEAGPLHAGILIAIGAALVCWLVQARTAFGFELLVTGLNPEAAALAGVPVARRQAAVLVLSGGFAGLAGTMQVLGVEGHNLGPNPMNYGYAGIAVALLGRLHPAGIVAAALFFGLLDQGAAGVEADFNVPQPLADVVKGTIILLMLAGAAWALRRRSRTRQA